MGATAAQQLLHSPVPPTLCKPRPIAPTPSSSQGKSGAKGVEEGEYMELLESNTEATQATGTGSK